jgi:hypothetical protein
VGRWRRAIVVCYSLAVVVFFVGYYLSVRGAALETSVDWTTPLLGLALLSILVGVGFGRWRVLLLPLVALPVALPIRFGLTMPPRELLREHANPAASTHEYQGPWVTTSAALPSR